MKKFEYIIIDDRVDKTNQKTVPLPLISEDSPDSYELEWLRLMGDNGWELTSSSIYNVPSYRPDRVAQGGGRQDRERLYFKRPIED